jgi:hypothetical protein
MPSAKITLAKAMGSSFRLSIILPEMVCEKEENESKKPTTKNSFLNINECFAMSCIDCKQITGSDDKPTIRLQK